MFCHRNTIENEFILFLIMRVSSCIRCSFCCVFVCVRELGNGFLSLLNAIIYVYFSLSVSHCSAGSISNLLCCYQSRMLKILISLRLHHVRVSCQILSEFWLIKTISMCFVWNASIQYSLHSTTFITFLIQLWRFHFDFETKQKTSFFWFGFYLE